MITSEEIKRRLWDGANELRGSMDASRYKDYMLGLMFYKFLSDKTLEAFRQALKLGSMTENELIDQYTEVANEFPEKVFNMIKNLLGYVVPPQYLYQKWLRDIDNEAARYSF